MSEECVNEKSVVRATLFPSLRELNRTGRARCQKSGMLLSASKKAKQSPNASRSSISLACNRRIRSATRQTASHFIAELLRNSISNEQAFFCKQKSLSVCLCTAYLFAYKKGEAPCDVAYRRGKHYEKNYLHAVTTCFYCSLLCMLII